MNEPLHDQLGEIAESVRNVDLYERSLHRSRRIGRRRASVVSAAAVAVLGLAGFGLINLPRAEAPTPPLLAAPVESPASSAPASSEQSTSEASGSQASRSNLPGRVFFRTEDGEVIRLNADGSTTTVLDRPSESASVSPDGKRVAYVVDGKLRLTGSSTPIYDGVVDPGQTPAWSPDGTRLIVSAPEPGTLTVATGAFAALTEPGDQFVFSGDGTQLIAGVRPCRLHVIPAAGGPAKTVPLLGDPSNAVNPDGSAACEPLSADRTGSLVTAPLVGLDGGSGSGMANALIETATGAVLPLPVRSPITGVLIGPDDNVLIRTADHKLTLVGPDRHLLVQVEEPAAVRGGELLGYTN